MAIVKNFWLQGASKRLAGAVLYEAMGQTRQRELATSVTNPRTTAQMTQRIKWSNLVNFYRANASWMKYAFENKKQTQSEYNKFMSLNVSSSRIALTKQAAAAGACVADNYIVTQGSLPSIEWRLAGVVYVSNIYTDVSFEITNATTVAEFSRVLINNNPALREGDQLSFIRESQMMNATSGYPYVIVRKYEVLLNTASTALLNDFIPVEFIGSENVEQDPVLFVRPEGRKGAFCMVLSRTISGKTYVSSQNLVVVNNNDIIGQWSNSAAIQAAIGSYGESEDAFLSSVSANQANNALVGNSVLAVFIEDVTYQANGATPKVEDIESAYVELIFSQAIPDNSVLGDISVILTNGTSVNPTNKNISEGKARFVMPTVGAEDANYHLAYISVVVDGTTYSIRFQNESAYSGGSLEE